MAIKTARLLKRLREDFQLSIITLMGLFGVLGISPTPCTACYTATTSWA